MRERVCFFVPGIPRPQGSKRYLGHGKMVEAGSKHLAPWRADVRAAAEQALGDDGPGALWDQPVKVQLIFWLPRPKAHFGSGRNANKVKPSAPRWPAGRPDLDKLARAVLDAITGVVIADDSTVVDLCLRKRYAHNGGPRFGVSVTVGVAR